MLNTQSVILVSDNSGAQLARLIGVLGNFSKKKPAVLGDIIVISVRSLKFKVNNHLSIKKGSVFKALVVRTKRNNFLKNKIGFYSLNFYQNSVVLLDSKFQLSGTRVFGPLCSIILRKKGFLKILALASNSFF
jgi:ribosomal protein L14